jgi:hypothetical protein
VLVRRDLPQPHQVVQACHACLEATRAFLRPDSEHPSLIVCGVRDEARLVRCLERLRRAGIACRAFAEPDRGGQLTALATEPVRGARRALFRSYQLLTGNEGEAVPDCR